MSPADVRRREDEAARQALRDLSHAAGTGGVDDNRMTSSNAKGPSPVKVLIGFLIVVAAVTAFAIWAMGRLG